MELKLIRAYSTEDETIGLLYELIKDPFNLPADKLQFLCYTLEDEFREIKVPGETRIPAGRYEIKLRTEGRLHEKYKQKFSKFHAGMLHLQDVKNFTYIELHIGNRESDTDGCILTGYGVRDKTVLIDSTTAYMEVYLRILTKLLKEKVFIDIIDFDRMAYTDPELFKISV